MKKWMLKIKKGIVWLLRIALEAVVFLEVVIAVTANVIPAMSGALMQYYGPAFQSFTLVQMLGYWLIPLCFAVLMFWTACVFVLWKFHKWAGRYTGSILDSLKERKPEKKKENQKNISGKHTVQNAEDVSVSKSDSVKNAEKNRLESERMESAGKPESVSLSAPYEVYKNGEPAHKRRRRRKNPHNRQRSAEISDKKTDETVNKAV